MGVRELIKSATYLVDSAGNKKAVQVDWSVWEELLVALEEQEADQRWEELLTNHPEVLERLAAEADLEVMAGRVTELVPEKR